MQNEIGSRAATEIDSEIERVNTELETLRAKKPGAIVAALIEAASGLRSDYATATFAARDCMVALAALERATGVERHARVVGTLPDFNWTNQVGDQAVAAPEPA